MRNDAQTPPVQRDAIDSGPSAVKRVDAATRIVASISVVHCNLNPLDSTSDLCTLFRLMISMLFDTDALTI